MEESISIRGTTAPKKVHFKRTREPSLSEYAKNERDTDTFCDFTIKIGTKCFPVMKVVLSHGSDYFHAFFHAETADRFRSEIVFSDIDENAMSLVIDYMYSGSITIDETNVCDLLAASEYFLIADLKAWCMEYMTLVLTSENYFAIHFCAVRYSCSVLLDTLATFFFENFDEITKTADYRSLGKDDVLRLLQNHKQFNSDEVFQAVIGWIKDDLDNRKKFFQEFMKYIDFENMPPGFVKDIVLDEPLVMENLTCLQEVVATLKKYIPSTPRASKKKSSCAERENKTSLLVIGGNYTKTEVNKIDLNTKQCKKVKDLPIDHVGGCVVSFNNSIYIAGGKNNRRVHEMKLNENNDICELQPMNETRQYASAAILNDELYVAGGFNSNNPCLSSVEKYSFATKKWENVQNMNQPRAYHSLVSSMGYLYSIGGFNGRSDYNSVERFDPNTNLWEYVSSKQFKTSGLTAVVCENEIYAIGGFSMKSCEKFSNGKWETIADMNIERDCAAACVINGKIYVVGGESNDAWNSTEMYDPATNTWTLFYLDNMFWYHSIASV